MEEELIELVRNEQCLYDVKHPDYVNFKIKEVIWKRIAEELHYRDGNVAKKHWEKLRNNHRDALRRQKQKGANVLRPWRFQDNMEFLVPYMGSRTNSHDERPHTLMPEVYIQENPDIEEFKTECEENLSPSPEQCDTSDDVSEPAQKRPRRSEERRKTSNDFTVNNVRNDPLFHFFLSMYESTRRLPALSQHTIKTNVFILVSKEESENLANSSTSHT